MAALVIFLALTCLGARAARSGIVRTAAKKLREDRKFRNYTVRIFVDESENDGRYAEAAPLLKRRLEIREKTPAREYPDIAPRPY